MRDTNGDGKVDQTAPFGDVQGTGVQHLQATGCTSPTTSGCIVIR